MDNNKKSKFDSDDDHEPISDLYIYFPLSDILNPIFSNIMHFTRITVGNKNRTNAQLYGYHEQLSETILYFMEEEKTHCPTSLPQNIWDE